MENKIKNDNVATGVTKKAYGVPYTVLNRKGSSHSQSGVKLYIFSESELVDMSFIEVEEKLNPDKINYVSAECMEVLYEKYKEEQSVGDLLTNPEVWKSVGAGVLDLDDRSVLLQIEAEYFNAKFIHEIVPILQKSLYAKEVIISVAVDDLQDSGFNSAYKHLQVMYPELITVQVKTYAEEYLAERWCGYFGVSLPDECPAREVLGRLKQVCDGKVQIQDINNFIELMSNITEEESGVPSTNEVKRFLQVQSGKNWREELNSMIGLEDVKLNITDIIAQQIYQLHKKKMGILQKRTPIRLTIGGNPGVGKSTILQILQEALSESGVLKKKPRYLSARNLIGDHVGATEKIIANLNTDLLIIDEISGLTNVKDDFTEVVVQQLTYLAEADPDLGIILCGYTESVNQFLEKNPGLRSRFPEHIQIPDYDEAELMNIAYAMLDRQGYIYNKDELEQSIIKFLRELRTYSGLYNARGVRNLITTIEKAYARRYQESGEFDLHLSKEIVERTAKIYLDSQPEEEKSRPIGF